MTSKGKKKTRKWLNNILPIFFAILLGLFIGGLVILIAGKNPLIIYGEMFNKSLMHPYLVQTLIRSIPIIISSIAIIASWRAGYINLGVEGQMIFGALAATVVALYVPGPPFLVMILSIIVGMIVGALYALIASILNLKFDVSIVISTLMMNYIANYIATYFVTYPLKDMSGDGLRSQTPAINEALRFSKIGNTGTFNTGFIIMIIVVIAYIFIERKTEFGYESKMTGLNPTFSKYGGINQKRTALKTMALSGAIAALGGIIEIFGVKYKYTANMFGSASYAWTGLMAALISGLNPVGSFIVGLFLSALQVGGQSIQRTTGIPIELSSVIQSCITLFVSAKLFTKFAKNRKKEKKLKEVISEEVR